VTEYNGIKIIFLVVVVLLHVLVLVQLLHVLCLIFVLSLVLLLFVLVLLLVVLLVLLHGLLLVLLLALVRWAQILGADERESGLLLLRLNVTGWISVRRNAAAPRRS